MTVRTPLSSRLQAVKDELVSRIPIRKAADRQELASKGLTDVIILYLSWQARLIRPRKRSVVVWPEVSSSPHYPAYGPAIAHIGKGFTQGDDMNAFLSHQVRNHAYVANLPSRGSMASQDWIKKNWRGKDRLRVTIDVQHLHLGAVQADSSVARTNELLFVGVRPDEAFLLAIGNHASFDDGSVSKLMYEKLDAELEASGGGVALAGPGVTLGGTQVKDTFRAIDLTRELRSIDAKLTAKGLSATQVSLRLDWDDLIVFDEAAGSELSRRSGFL